MSLNSVIVGTGKCIPSVVIKNDSFINYQFHEKTGERLDRTNEEIITKLKEITEIEERRYAEPGQVSSDLAAIAGEDALTSSGIDRETLDYIIVAHNFGDVRSGTTRVDMVPSLASRVKHTLGIKNPDCVGYDLPFGCPGWLQGMIQANYYLRSGDAKRVMVIGSETLSRVSDPHDRDSMIFADGAGATILEGRSNTNSGILSHKAQTHTANEAYYLYAERSSNPAYAGDDLFIKMDGRKIYEYALTNVPLAIKATIEKAGVEISDIKKIVIHQANAKMDEAILRRLYKLYNIADAPHGIMPLTISKLGNSSVATIPTLLDMMLKKEIRGQEINKGDIVVFASVGAGMNINAMTYRF
jgi:3-oxoacyl-[acyl-carrier-protein] synthase III